MLRLAASMALVVVLVASAFCEEGSFHRGPKVSFDPESLIASELDQAASRRPPPPEPGFGVAISGDFDAMMRQAPILDPEHSQFHAGNAFFWHEQFSKLYVVGLSLTSQAFQEMLQGLGATREGQTATPIEVMRGLIARLKSFTPRNHHDEFAQRFTVAYLADWTRLAEVAVEVTELAQRLNAHPSPEHLRSAATLLRARATEVRLTIYRPSVSPQDVPRRQAMWQALQKLAVQAETGQQGQ